MITGALKLPFKPTSTHAPQYTRQLLLQAEAEINVLLAQNTLLTPETRLKLSIEKKFLRLRELYHQVLGQLRDHLLADTHTTRLFSEKLLDRNFFRREKVPRYRNEGRT